MDTIYERDGVYKIYEIDGNPVNGLRVSEEDAKERELAGTATISSYIDSPKHLGDLKHNLKKKINHYKNELIESPITHNGETFDADKNARQSFLGAIERANKVGAAFNINWITKENNVKNLTQTEINNIGDAIMDRQATIIYAATTKKGEVDTFTSRAQIESYNIESGW